MKYIIRSVSLFYVDENSNLNMYTVWVYHIKLITLGVIIIYLNTNMGNQ